MLDKDCNVPYYMYDMVKASVRQLQDTPGKYLHDCRQSPVEITSHGKTVAFIVDPQHLPKNMVMTNSNRLQMANYKSTSLSLDDGTVLNISVTKGED